MSKINLNKTHDIGATRLTNKTAVTNPETATTKPSETKTEPTKDQVSFSDRSAEVGKLVDQIKNLPDERKGLVHQFKTEISTDQYKPSSIEIADAIISDEN